MAIVEVQNMEEMWILLAPLTAYVSKLGAFARSRLELFFSALDISMTHRTLLYRTIAIARLLVARKAINTRPMGFRVLGRKHIRVTVHPQKWELEGRNWHP